MQMMSRHGVSRLHYAPEVEDISDAESAVPTFDLGYIEISSDSDQHDSATTKKPVKTICKPKKKKSKSTCKLHQDLEKKSDFDPPPSSVSASGLSQHPFGPPLPKEQAEKFKFRMFALGMDKKILWATNMYEQWMKSGFMKDAPDINCPEQFPKSVWCQALCGFITQVKKLDGTDFPSHTLYEITVCIQMYFETRGLH